MTDSNKIAIPLSRAKLTRLVILSILFLAAGLWIIISNPQISNPFFNHPVVKIIASCASVMMGLSGIYIFAKKLFDKKPGLILSEEGIYDNTSAFKFGFIPWTDIAEIYEKKVQGAVASKQYFVTIGLNDPDKYISGVTNTIKRKLLIANSKHYGSPVHLSTNGLKIDHKDLLKLVNEYFEKCKNATGKKLPAITTG